MNLIQMPTISPTVGRNPSEAMELSSQSTGDSEMQYSVHFQGKPFNITVIQVYAPTTNAEEAEVEGFYENLQDILEHQKKKKKKMSLSS